MSKRKNNQKATPLSQSTSVTSKKLIELTEQEMEQVQGGVRRGNGAGYESITL
jgi:bacteriocin-like protein